AGGARRRTSERSATGCSWQRTAVRLSTVITTAGITTHSGVRTTAPKVDAAAGANAAKTTTATQRITTVLRVRGMVVAAPYCTCSGRFSRNFAASRSIADRE